VYKGCLKSLRSSPKPYRNADALNQQGVVFWGGGSQ